MPEVSLGSVNGLDDDKPFLKPSLVHHANSVYDGINERSWLCYKCDNHNVDSFSFHAYNVPTENRYTPLSYSSSDMDHYLNHTVSLSSPGMPKHSSPIPNDVNVQSTGNPLTPTPMVSLSTIGSPEMFAPEDELLMSSSLTDPFGSVDRPSRPEASNSQNASLPRSAPTTSPQETTSGENGNNFRVAVVNSNSARNKKAEFTNFIQYTKPDIILITETKIDGTIASSEFLPDGYLGKIRNDRNLFGGGVMIAYKQDLDIVDFVIHDNQAESVWAKILLKDHPPIVIGSVYRQDASSSVDQILNIESNLDFITESMGDDSNFTLMMGGDFNLPDIDWQNSALRAGPDRKHVEITQKMCNVAMLA